MAPTHVSRLVLLVATFLASPHAAVAQCATWSPSFHLSGPGGFTYPSGDPGPLEVYDDGSGAALYMGGSFELIDGQPAGNLAKWDGAAWTPITNPFSGAVVALKTFDDGSGPALYAGGTSVQGGTHSFVARWNGSSWAMIGANFGGTPRTLAVFDDGSGPALYAGGYFSSVGGIPANGIAKWNGSAWIAVGSGLDGHVYALAVHDDGSGPALYAGGDVSVAGTFGVARWNGASWSSVGGGFNSYVYALRSFDPGTGAKLYAGGDFNSIGGLGASRIAAWDGNSWSAVGTGVTAGNFVGTFEVWDDGNGPALFVGGGFTSMGGLVANTVARWNGSAWSALRAGLGNQQYPMSVTAIRAFDEGQGARLFACGNFSRSGSVVLNNFARWNGSTWSSPTHSTTTNGPVEALETWDDGSGAALYVGGSFTGAGGELANNVAKFDGTHWSSLGNGLPEGAVFALQPYDDGHGAELYAGGTFTNPSTGVGTICIARWNGSTWSALPGGEINGIYPVVRALAVFDSGSGPRLYAGGTFTAAGGVGVHHIAKWDGSAWSDVGGGVSNSLYSTVESVRALRTWDSGGGTRLYVGGQFDTVGGVHSGYVAVWGGTGWGSLAGGLVGPNPTTYTSSLAVWDDGTGSALFAAGNFLGTGSVPCVYEAKWNGSAWSTVGNGTDRESNALGVHDDGTGNGSALYFGGLFSDASGTAANHIARWDGTSYSALGNGITGSGDYLGVSAITSFHGDLYAGGNFLAASGISSPYFARWGGCGQAGELFCFGDGSGTLCPCGNASNVGDRVGCLNSQNLGASLRASGEPSLAHDTLVLHGAQMPNGSALYFQGTNEQNGGAGTMFGDGLRCAGGSVLRLMTKTPSGGVSQYPDAGDPPVSVRGLVPSPATRTYQIRYRNAASFCTSAAFNLSNGVEIVWGP